MTYLSEDPTFLAGGLLLLAGGFAFAMRVTQQGKYLLYAVIAAVMALVVVVVERFWVTDGERIEQVVYGLRQAVASSDVDGVLAYLAPDVLYTRGDVGLNPDETRAYIRENLGRARFDLVQISSLETSVSEQARRGKAEFRVMAKGTLETSLTPMRIGTLSSAWSLGLRETERGVWKVNRITPLQIPNDALTPPNGVRGTRPTASAPDDGETRLRRKTTRGAGHPVDSRFFSSDGARDGKAARNAD